VLVGPPNVGKSRLFNALVGRDRAIVSTRAGTTRDYLSELCDCEGLTVELVDTAGIDAPAGAVESQAQSLRVFQAGAADLVLECHSAELAERTARGLDPDSLRLHVWTKGDLARWDAGTSPPAGSIVTSAVTGAGLDALRSAIGRTIKGRESGWCASTGTGARCRGSIRGAEAALRSAAETLLHGGGDELVSFDLRLAIDELGRVVGAVVTDDVLERIFRRFCIGK
jgi:tRNA modification GTPase